MNMEKTLDKVVDSKKRDALNTLKNKSQTRLISSNIISSSINIYAKSKWDS